MMVPLRLCICLCWDRASSLAFELVIDSDAGTGMTTMTFEKRIHMPSVGDVYSTSTRPQ